jgi:hypothetical protein
MERLCSGVLAVALALAAGPARAGSFEFDAHFTESDLEGLAEAFGDTLTFPNLGTAAPTGLPGFEVLAAAGGPQVDTGSDWWHYVDASTAGGVLYGQRLILRKGLPFNLDVGVQAGQVAGESFQGAEVRWAVLEGGTVSPAVALRASYSRLSTSPFACEVAEGQLLISKGFLVVSPYGGVGYRRVSARASYGEPEATHSVDHNRGTVTVGARVTLFPFLHIVGEARKSSKVSIFFGVGVGL